MLMLGSAILMLNAVGLVPQAGTSPPSDLDPQEVQAILDRHCAELPAEERKQHVEALVTILNSRPRSGEERREMLNWLKRKLDRGDSWASMVGRVAGTHERSAGQETQPLPDTLGWREARGHMEYVKAGLEERFSHPIPDPATREVICTQLASVGERLRECALRKISGLHAAMLVDTKIKQALEPLLRQIRYGVRGGYYRPFEPWEMAQIVSDIEAVADQHPPVEASSEVDRRYAEGHPIRGGDESLAVDFLSKLFQAYWDITRFTTPKTRAAWKAYADARTASTDWFAFKQASAPTRADPRDLARQLTDMPKVRSDADPVRDPSDAPPPVGAREKSRSVGPPLLLLCMLLLALAVGAFVVKRRLNSSRPGL